MVTTAELLRQGRRDEIWSKYCGFLDLKLQEFMDIQRRLLLEQIGLLSRCELGRALLGDAPPASVDEFRLRVPMTTYADYASWFEERRDEHLPLKPQWWLRTSGRTGDMGGYKWVPYPPDMARRLGEAVMALFILAAVDGPGQFPFVEGDRLLYTMAPFPYMSGGVAARFSRSFRSDSCLPWRKQSRCLTIRGFGKVSASPWEKGSITSMPSPWSWCGSPNSFPRARAA